MNISNTHSGKPEQIMCVTLGSRQYQNRARYTVIPEFYGNVPFIVQERAYSISGLFVFWCL